MDVSYAYFQADPRIPASDHPLSDSLAPAMARLNTSCTAWITKGGMLITAGHCNPEQNDIVEFNVPLSNPNGSINYSLSEDTYTVREVVNSDDNPPDRDWAIFRVNDNPVTGLQPIEAQLVYIELVQDLTGDTYRSMGYGSDAGIPGPLHKTLRTDSGEHLTQNTTGDLVEFKAQLISGDSGSPIIDESTGKSVGVAVNFRTSDDVAEGTSAYRSSFWNTYQAELNDFTLAVTQKDETGQVITGSSIGRWDGSIFSDHILSGSTVQLSVVEGDIEVLRADQGIYNNPQEKYNRWEGFTDVSNHRVFQVVPSAVPLTSQFQKSYSGITVTNQFPEAPSLSGGHIQFKDPWLIDYADPSFGNNMRNRGMDAEFYSHSAPFTPGFNAINGKLYNGLFLNEIPDPNDPEVPYYSVRTEPQTINFGGSLGQREVVPLEWEGFGANFQNPDAKETAVVFTSSSAEARSNMKVSRVTNTAESNSSPGQRKIVRTANGWLHRTYESLGRVWYEAKPPGGDWEFIYKWSSIYVDDSGGSAPSIAAASNASTPAYPNSVILAWQQGTDVKMRIYYYISSMGTYSNWYDYTLSDAVTSATQLARPNVVYSGQNQFIVLWETATGISFTLLKMDSSGFVEIASDSIPGTDGNSGQVAASSDINYYFPYFDVAWVQSGSGGASSIKFQQISESSGSVVYSKSSPVTISSSYMFLNANPSVITVNNQAVFSWMCRGTSSWAPMSQSACLRSYDYVTLGPFTQYDVSVANASLGRVGSNDYYVAWSQYYYYPESQYNNDLNRYAKSTSLSNKQTLNTDFRDIQLYDAPVGQDMRLSVFQHAGSPKYFDLSRPLDTSPLKAVSDTARQSARGLIVSAADKDGIYLEIGGFEVDGRPVSFTQVPGLPTSDSRSIEQLRQLPSAPKPYRLEDVQPYLLSEPFLVTGESDLVVGSHWNAPDSVLTDLLGATGTFNFAIDLVTEVGTHSVGELHQSTLSAGNSRGQSENQLSFHGTLPTVTENKVRLRLSVDTNVKDLSYTLVNSYYDEDDQARKQARDIELSATEEITEFELSQNYPNPFNPTTQISYQLPEDSVVRLEIYDLLGRRVQILVNDNQQTGRHTVTFDASGLASGVYIYRLQAGEFTQSRKLYLIK